MTDPEKELDKALAGKSHSADVTALVETAAELRTAFTVEVPEARSESVFFTNGVGLRKRSPLFVRLLLPVVAVACVITALVIVGRNAVPGDSLYPVRGALKKVGLASAPIREIDREIRLARNLVVRAETAVLDDPDRAQDFAHEAIGRLGDAWDLVEDLDPGDRSERVTRIRALEQRADMVIVQAALTEDRQEDTGSGSSGPGSDDDGDSDSSGPGSGDPDDGDSSGPGSDESDDDGDSSGPGSGESDDDGDSSGPGSGDSDDDGDSSGSGSSGSGSGDDDDNSGPG